MLNYKFKILLCIGIFMIPFTDVIAKAKVSTSFGYKNWASTYKVSDNVRTPPREIESVSGSSSGPTFNIRINRFFGGVNFYKGSYKYEFVNVNEIERTDLEIYGGYDFVRNFSVIGGIKEISSTWKSISLSTEFDLDYAGPFVAINGRSNVMAGFLFFFTGSYTYLAFDDSDDTDESRDLSGASIEFGAAFITARNHLILTVSFKNQAYKSDIGFVDDISGLTFGVNGRF